jgi:peptidyl-tRNA hydrolase, PTH1 family
LIRVSENALVNCWLRQPGTRIQLTPHNLGFLTVDRLGERHRIRITRPECQAYVGAGKIGQADVLLVKPDTYMNLSGVAVKALLAKYELKPADLLLVYDELALPWMQLRVRPRGSSAGHNGVKSVIASIGTEEFARLRIGVSPGEGRAGGQKYLLSPIRRGLEKELDELLDNACNAVESITAEGVEKSMAIYNRSARGEKEEA